MASQTTTDHDTIRRWAEGRQGRARPGSWDDWFRKFEGQRLALVYQDQTEGGEQSNFNKLVSRDGQ